MSSFFSNSILDEFALSKDKFETVVGLGASKAEVRRIFCLSLLAWNGEPTQNVDVLDLTSNPNSNKHISFLLDSWCKQNYNGIPFDSLFALIQQMTVKKFEDAMLELGIRGNPSAISIMNEVIRGKSDNALVQVNFVNNIPLEDDDDKQDD